MKPTAEQIKTIALIVDGEAWKAIEDGRDALPGSLWGFRRDIAMEKAMAIAALSVQPAAAVVGEPVGMGVFRNGEMIGFVGIGDEFKLPEDTDERRPIYAAPLAAAIDDYNEARKAAFIEAAEIAGKLFTAEFTPQEPGFMRGIGYAAQTIFDDLRAKAEETRT